MLISKAATTNGNELICTIVGINLDEKMGAQPLYLPPMLASQNVEIEVYAYVHR